MLSPPSSHCLPPLPPLSPTDHQAGWLPLLPPRPPPCVPALPVCRHPPPQSSHPLAGSPPPFYLQPLGPAQPTVPICLLAPTLSVRALSHRPPTRPLPTYLSDQRQARRAYIYRFCPRLGCSPASVADARRPPPPSRDPPHIPLVYTVGQPSQGHVVARASPSGGRGGHHDIHLPPGPLPVWMDTPPALRR